MWNLSEEKVAELERLMEAKKKERDALEARHIHELWSEDLDALLETLDKVEEKEEADRLAHGGVKNEGKQRKKKAAPARKPTAKDKENNNKNEATKKAPRKPAAKKPAKEKEVPEPTLRERLAARGG